MSNDKLPAAVTSLLDIYQQPFVLVDRQFTIVAANKAYAAQYNQRPEDIVNRKCHQVSHNSEQPCQEIGEDCPHRRMFNSGQVEEALHIHTRIDGTKECVEIKAHPIRGDDGEVLYMGEQLRPVETQEMLRDNDLVGTSEAFLDAVRDACLIAKTDVPVLICGESGVGKERFAAYIHNRSMHADAPFITLDSCGLNESLFESELFGNEAGAFTDARTKKKGLFELADGGTLFLDEIGEISPTIQAKLLRVLDTGQFRRVGGTETLTANVRLVSATNRNLLEMVEEGTFRRDLYYRLVGDTISLPPLRDRKVDIPALTSYFMQSIDKKATPTADSMRLLQEYNFPGNIRELKYIVELAVLKATDGYINPEHLPEPVTSRQCPPESQDPHDRRIDDQLILGVEAGQVFAALRECRGSRRSAARELNISERKMYRIIQRFREAGIPVPKPYQ